ncbi:MAG: hypothetical protein IJU70_06285 [Lentisphaeria bacterium]|nr:hypothetical protein [Lentisphaeria bacterium]
MKKLLSHLAAFALLPAFAELPPSITVESGNIRLRLDAGKRWNINRIEWKNTLCGIDTPGAHYGAVYRPADGKFPIGTGHDESGVGEKLLSLKIFSDGREIAPSGKIIRGKQIRIERISDIADLSSQTTAVIENDVIRETTRITAKKTVRLDHLYVFMHPWSPRFDRFHAVGPDGKRLDVTFKSDNAFPNRKFVPAAAWYDTKTGIGAATFIRNIAGKKAPMRYLWDRRSYRKDYLCDYYHATITAGQAAVWEAVTGFFQQTDSGKWVDDAELLLKKLASAME